MLRLRPTEIALTSADVEETLRNLANRRALAHPTSSRGLRPGAHHGRGPRLRRGPEHSVSDAITHLEPIPFLQPQQAVLTSTDSDDEEDETSGEELSSAQVHTRDATISNARAQTTPQRQQQASPRNLQLPFRPARREGAMLGSSAPALAQADSTDDTEEDSTPSPPKRQPRPPDFGRAMTNTSDDHGEIVSRARFESATDGLSDNMDYTVRPELSDMTPRAGSRPTRNVAQLIPQRSGGTSSPLRQPPAVGSPVQPQRVGSRASQGPADPNNLPPTVHLQGFFTSPGRYHFREHHVPQTEPRQRPNRSAHRTRTMSSNSDPAQLALAMGSGHVRMPPSRDFWASQVSEQVRRPTHAESEASDNVQSSEAARPRSSFDERVRRAHRRIESMQGRYRGFFGRSRPDQPESDPATFVTATERQVSQHVSEASSNSSLPYSYYELPNSRHASNDHSQAGQLPQAQVDGASSSREVSRGAYFSIRPSHVRVSAEGRSRQGHRQRSSVSSPNLAALFGQHGISAMPASPYTRTHNDPSVPRSTTGLITLEDVLDDDRDAAVAIERDLSSPLDLLEQRATSEFARVSAALATATAQLPMPNVPNAPTRHHRRVSGFGDVEAHPRRMPTMSMRQHSGNNAHLRVMPSIRRPVEQRPLRPTGDGHERAERVPTPAIPLHGQRRAPPSGRIGQRSSENVPVGGSTSHSSQGAPRTAQPQAQRASFGLNHRQPPSHGANMRGGGTGTQSSPLPARFSLPQGLTSRELIEDPRAQSPPQPRMRRSSRNLNRTDEPSTTTSSSSPIRAYRRMMQRRASRSQRDSMRRDPSREPQRQTPHPPDVLPYQNLQQPTHPATAIVTFREAQRERDRGTRSSSRRRPPIPARVASRRISAAQLNQENSGEAEAELMREEMMAAGMRYSEDVAGLEVMDETPPRVGRFERHMMGN